MWLTVHDNGFWHTVPCDEEGNVLEPHTPDPDCLCHPEMEFHQEDDEDEDSDISILLIHNQLN